MPRVQTMTSKKFPKGWEIVEPFLTELQDKLNDLNNLPAESKRRVIILFRMKITGQFINCTTRGQDTFMKCITRKKKQTKIYMIICVEKSGPIRV